VVFHDDVISDDIGKNAYDICKNFPSRRILLDTIRRLQKAYGLPKERMYMRLGINCRQIGDDSRFMKRDRQSNPGDFVREVNLAKVRKFYDDGKYYSVGKPKYRTTKYEPILKSARPIADIMEADALETFELLLRNSPIANHNRKTRLLNSQYKRATIIYPKKWTAEAACHQEDQAEERLSTSNLNEHIHPSPPSNQERSTTTKKTHNHKTSPLHYETATNKLASKKQSAPFTWLYNHPIPEKYSTPYAPGWPMPYVQWVHPSIQKSFGEIALLIYDTYDHEGDWQPPKTHVHVRRRHRAEGVFFVRQRMKEEDGVDDGLGGGLSLDGLNVTEDEGLQTVGIDGLET
jgi:hypothetical protein